MTPFLSDDFIMKTIDLLKSDYFLVTSFALLVFGWIAKKTKAKWDDKIYLWLKGKFNLRGKHGG